MNFKTKEGWMSSLYLAPKKNETWRPWGYHCGLNAVTAPNRYPLWHIQNIATGLVD